MNAPASRRLRASAEHRPVLAAADRAKRRALLELSRRYPAEFKALHDAHRAAEGLPPVGAAPRGKPAAGRPAPLVAALASASAAPDLGGSAGPPPGAVDGAAGVIGTPVDSRAGEGVAPGYSGVPASPAALPTQAERES